MRAAVVVWALMLPASCGAATTEPAFDFDGGDAQGWHHVWGDLPDQPTASKRVAFNAHRDWFLGTAEIEDGYDDRRTGSLHSPEFTIEHDYIVMRVGGGNKPKRTFASLRCGSKDRPRRHATGFNDETMRTVIWQVDRLKGKTCKIVLVDKATGPWGHINLDYVRFVDQ